MLAWQVGLALLLADNTHAIDLLMSGQDSGGERLLAARDTWRRTKDPRATLKLLPRSQLRERLMLQGLVRYGMESPHMALRCIPFQARTMYAHALQSFVWNVAAARRIELLGQQPVAGDLLLVGNDNGKRSTVWCWDGQAPHPDTGQPPTLQDVVLPMVGTGVMLPSNAVGDEIRQHLRELGLARRLDIDAGAAEQGERLEDDEAGVFVDKVPRGSYRALVAQPVECTWTSADSDVETEGRNKNAIIRDATFKFTLGAGSYATVCLREIAKCNSVLL